MSRDLNKLLGQPLLQINQEIQRQTEYLRHIIDYQTQRLVRETQVAYQQMNPDWAALINSNVFDAMQRIHESASRTLVDSTALRAAKAFESWQQPIYAATQSLTETNRQLIQEMNSISLPALQAISNEAIRHFQSASALSLFPESFVGQILDHLQSISDSEDQEDVEREAEKIEALFSQGVSRLRPDLISREGMIQILLALMILWYQLYEGVQTEQRILNVIYQTEARLLEKIETLRPEEASDVFYMVLRRKAQLRSGPSIKKPVIGILYPPQRVSLLESKGKWIYVRYFNYVEGVPQSGWTLKKYLKRIDGIGRAPIPRAKPRPKFGSGKGVIKMSDDFDAPLKDFEDYC